MGRAEEGGVLMARTTFGTLLALLALAWPTQGRAEQIGAPTGTVTAEAQPAPDRGVPRMDQYTAFTVGKGRLKLGILAFEYGITDRLSVGTDPPMWAARAAVDVLVPNGHVKYTALQHPRLLLTGQLGVYYADVSKFDNAGGSLLVVPLTLWASLPVAPKRWPKLWAHLEGVYNWVEGWGTGSVDRIDLAGSVTTEAIQLGAMLEYRLQPRLAFTLRGRVQPWMNPLEITADRQFDPYTRIDVRAELEPRHEHPFAVVAGATYFWKHVHASVGVGYGNYFLYGMNLYSSYQGVIPDASISLLF
jgi:hypothetical protein